MTRVEELTFDLADGVLSDEAGRELERLLAEDGHASWSHLALLDLEAALRASRLEMDLTGRTMDRLRAALAEEVESGVMEAIRSTRGSGRAGAGLASAGTDMRGALRSPGRLRRIAIYLAAAACLAAVLGLGLRSLRERVDTAVASLARDGPGVVILRGSRQVPAVRGAKMFPGDRVEVSGGDHAEIELSSGIRIELGAHARIALEQGSIADEVRIALERGALRMRKRTPHGGRLLIATAHAEVESHGSPVAVLTAEARTRVEAREGPARVRRLRDGAAVDVPAGYFVVAEDHSLEPLVPRSIHHPEIDLHQAEEARKEHDRRERNAGAPENGKKQP